MIPIIPTKLSALQMAQVMYTKVPIDVRLESVYVPTILSDNACFHINTMVDILHEGNVYKTKALSRRIRQTVREYQSRNRMTMNSDLYRMVFHASTLFYDKVNREVPDIQTVYEDELRDRYPGKFAKDEIIEALSYAYFSKRLLEFTIERERRYSNVVQSYLGKIDYHANDNVYCTELLKCMKGMIEQLEGPADLHSEAIEHSFQQFQSRVEEIDVKSICKNKQ